MPWAALVACGIVFAAEFGLHLTKWPNPIPYQQGRDEYFAVAATLDRAGSADVAIIGSSRPREAVFMPTAVTEMKRAFGPGVQIANYSVGGARAIDYEAIVNRLLRADPKPRIIALGIAERDFAGTRWQYDNVAYYWNLHDWRTNYDRRGSAVLADLPTALRNTAGQWVRLLGRREIIRVRVSEILRGIGPHEMTSPLRGEPSYWHTRQPKKTIDRKDKELAAKVKAYVARDLDMATYPNAEQVAAFDRMVALCKQKKVRLVLYEMPISTLLTQYLPPGMNDVYRTTVSAIAKRHGVEFIRLRDLEWTGTFRDFREHSHINLAGAKRFTPLLMEHAIVPALKRELATTRPAAGSKTPAKKKRPTTAATSPAPMATAPTSTAPASVPGTPN